MLRSTSAHSAGLAGALVLAVTLTACGGDPPKKATPTPSCPVVNPAPTMRVATGTIYVNVINAGGVHGLASKTQTQLTWRGFRVLSAKTKPLSDPSPDPTDAEIHYGKGARQIALTLAAQVKDAKLVEIDRPNPVIDLVLGKKFALVPVPPPAATAVKVKVYNTTFRPGLASQVAGQLRSRGFGVLAEGNDPGKSFLPNQEVRLRYGEQGEPAARRVALQFGSAEMAKDKRTDTTVDVVIGNKYQQLVPAAKATPKPQPTRSVAAACKTSTG